MSIRCGDTLLFQTPPVIAAGAAVGGKKEGEGPLAAEFDELSADNRFGQSSWEAAETYLQLRAARLCLQKAALPQEKVQLALAGDLQAQCTASSYALRELHLPFVGLFGACSTMAEGLALGAALCESGAARALLAMASSHFCAAERQFRTPLSYGAVRTPTAQWTATAAGCCLLQPQGAGVGIAAAAFGRVQDYQVKDINNMGAAMAPAAASTLLHYFKDTNTEPQEFDCIYTGDLGQTGSQLLRELLAAEGIPVRVVNVPSEGLFRDQPRSYQESVLPAGVARYGMTSGLPVNLRGLVGENGVIHGLDHFGWSAPYKVLDEKFGYNGATVAAEVKKMLGK